VDICDLGAKLYGEWLRPYLQVLIVTTNGIALIMYTMFFGFISDQLMCKTFHAAECGNNRLYSAAILIFLFPVLCLRRLSKIGIFSAIAMSFTLLAIVLILVMCGEVYSKSADEDRDDYGLAITEDDRDYNYFDGMMIPVVCATLNSLFEGNQVILNIYAESDKPKSFFTKVAIAIVSLSLGIVITVGYLGYLAFGNSVKSVIVYNFPNEDPLAITVKLCYVLTISGSYVLLVQPVFHIIESCLFYKNGTCCCCAKPVEEDEEGDEEKPWTCLQLFKFLLVRFLIVVIIFFFSILVPNVNIMLIISGSLCGTLVNIVIPVLFYNRAYNGSEKNKKLEDGDHPEDGRRWIKACNWVFLVIGILVGVWGLVFVAMNFGSAHADKV